MEKKPIKVSKKIINENEILDNSSIKKVSKIVAAKTRNQRHQVSSVLTTPLTPFKAPDKNKKQSGNNNINLDLLTPILTPARTNTSLLTNDKYIKLRNVSNACFANVTIHAFLSLGEQFFSEVGSFIYFFYYHKFILHFS